MKICLDVGNVLVHSNFEEFIKKLSKTLNITIEEANYFMNRTQKLHDLGCTQMVDELRDHFKIRSQVSLSELLMYWNEVIIPSDFLINIVNDLSQNHQIEVALLSNVGLEHATRMEQVLSACSPNFFEKTIKHFSCNVGARKPTLLYYHLFLQLYPEWRGCAYLDDLTENLEASKQFGFKTFHFSLESLKTATNEELKAKRKEIKKFLINS